MKKLIILCITLLILGYESIGQTNVSGLITSNTTWSQNGSPYIVVGNILIDQGKTLTIEPGVQVKFDGLYYIYSDGTLIAQGTLIDSILFTSNNITPKEGNWIGIKFRSTDTNSIIKYSNIEFAQSAIIIDGSSPKISNSMIKNNTNGIYINWNNGYPIIENNVISHNSNAGIYGGTCGRTNIIGNEISYNNYGIYTNTYDYNLNNNNIIYNSEGVYFDLGGEGYINEMNGNSILYNSVNGIYFKGYPISISSPFSNNIIKSNGNGIYCKDFQGIITNNVISNNEIGIWNAQGTKPSNLLINLNCFNNKTLNLKQLRTDNINATDNWWGTTDSIIIASLIYDFYDDFDLGKVLIFPILNTSNCLSIIDISESINTFEKFQIILHPNPSKGKFTINFNDKIYSIIIYNLYGEIIYTIPNSCLQTSNEIDISDFQKGIYLIRVNQKDKFQIEKVMIY